MEAPIEIGNKKYYLAELCKKYKVSRLFIFGSLATGNFNTLESDVDLIAEIEETNPVEKGENIMKLWSELESLFARKVDLLTSSKTRNPYLQTQINSTKKLIYDGTRS